MLMSITEMVTVVIHYLLFKVSRDDIVFRVAIFRCQSAAKLRIDCSVAVMQATQRIHILIFLKGNNTSGMFKVK